MITPMLPKERAADLRLQRLYGITLDEYNQQLKRQNGRCAICKRPPKRLRLAVDHNHATERSKITVSRRAVPLSYIWTATAYVGSDIISAEGYDKATVTALVRAKLRRRSVRGLLCWVCNRKILGVMERFKVRPAAVAAYLKQYDPSNPLVNSQQEMSV